MTKTEYLQQLKKYLKRLPKEAAAELLKNLLRENLEITEEFLTKM